MAYIAAVDSNLFINIAGAQPLDMKLLPGNGIILYPKDDDIKISLRSSSFDVQSSVYQDDILNCMAKENEAVASANALKLQNKESFNVVNEYIQQQNKQLAANIPKDLENIIDFIGLEDPNNNNNNQVNYSSSQTHRGKQWENMIKFYGPELDGVKTVEESTSGKSISGDEEKSMPVLAVESMPIIPRKTTNTPEHVKTKKHDSKKTESRSKQTVKHKSNENVDRKPKIQRMENVHFKIPKKTDRQPLKEAQPKARRNLEGSFQSQESTLQKVINDLVKFS